MEEGHQKTEEWGRKNVRQAAWNWAAEQWGGRRSLSPSCAAVLRVVPVLWEPNLTAAAALSDALCDSTCLLLLLHATVLQDSYADCRCSPSPSRLLFCASSSWADSSSVVDHFRPQSESNHSIVEIKYLNPKMCWSWSHKCSALQLWGLWLNWDPCWLNPTGCSPGVIDQWSAVICRFAFAICVALETSQIFFSSVKSKHFDWPLTL